MKINSDLSLSEVRPADHQRAQLIEESRGLILSIHREHPDLVMVVCDIRNDKGKEIAKTLELTGRTAAETIAVDAVEVAKARCVPLSAEGYAMIENRPPSGFRLVIVTGESDDAYLAP